MSKCRPVGCGEQWARTWKKPGLSWPWLTSEATSPEEVGCPLLGLLPHLSNEKAENPTLRSLRLFISPTSILLHKSDLQKENTSHLNKYANSVLVEICIVNWKRLWIPREKAWAFQTISVLGSVPTLPTSHLLFIAPLGSPRKGEKLPSFP